MFTVDLKKQHNNNNATPATDGKMLVSVLYHSAVVSGLAAGYDRLGKMAIGDSPSLPPPPEARLYTPRCGHGRVGRRSRNGDQGHMLIKQGLIPAEILK